MSTITNIATALPPHRHDQAGIGEFMAGLYQYTGRKKDGLLALYKSSGINTRYSYIPDYSQSADQRIFFPDTEDLEPFPNLEFRMKFFNTHAPQLCMDAIAGCFTNGLQASDVTHLITVSCTGISAPGLDIELVRRLGLAGHVARTSVNFMGCYAALHALKQADHICRSQPGAIVLVVCVELCTIHFQKADVPDNIIANLLFSDGAAACIVVADDVAEKKDLHGLALRQFFSHITLSGSGDMVWEPTSTGFLMTLSSYVPELIEKGIKELFQKTIEQSGVSEDDITHWAIHPGGKKILSTIQKQLGLTAQHLESSLNVLRDYGNMSSPTFLFVLKELWEQKINFDKPEVTFGVAFGPGLTMEAVVMQNV